MNLKIICGKVYGADLNRKEREGMEIEIRKELENVRHDLEDTKFHLYRRVLKLFKIFG